MADRITGQASPVGFLRRPALQLGFIDQRVLDESDRRYDISTS